MRLGKLLLSFLVLLFAGHQIGVEAEPAAAALAPRRRTYVSSPRRRTYVSSPRRRTYVSSPRRRTYVASPRRRTYVVVSPRRRSVIVVGSPRRRSVVVVGGGGFDDDYYRPSYYDGRRRSTVYVNNGGGGDGGIGGLIILICCIAPCIWFCFCRGDVGSSQPVYHQEPLLVVDQGPSFPPRPAGLDPDVARCFVAALRREYQQGIGNSVGSFFESDAGQEAGPHGELLEQIENMVRPNPNSIDALERQWGL